MSAARRLALVVCLLHQAQVRARDEVATMFCKRMAAITKKAKEHLVLLREQHRADAERLLGVFGDVLGAVREGLSPSADESSSTSTTTRRPGRSTSLPTPSRRCASAPGGWCWPPCTTPAASAAWPPTTRPCPPTTATTTRR